MRCKKMIFDIVKPDRGKKCCPNYAKRFFIVKYKEQPRWKPTNEEAFGFCKLHMDDITDLNIWNAQPNSRYERNIYQLAGEIAELTEVDEKAAMAIAFSNESTYLKNRFMNIMSQKNVSKIKYEEWEEILSAALNELQIKRVMED